MNSVSSRWFEDLDQNDRQAKELRRELLANSSILDVLAKIIQKDLDTLNRSPEKDYDNPNWSFREADRNGQYRALQHIYSLTKRTSK